MIHFRCARCGQKVIVRDEFAGRQGKCPNCKSQVTIPEAPTAPPPPAAAPGALVKFFCFRCGQRIAARQELGGKRIKCPHCGVVTEVPYVQTPAAKASAAAGTPPKDSLLNLADDDADFDGDVMPSVTELLKLEETAHAVEIQELSRRPRDSRPGAQPQDEHIYGVSVQHKKCPSCDGDVPVDEKKCMYCHEPV